MRVNVDAILRAGTSTNTLRAHDGDEKYFWAWAKVRYRLKKAYPVEESVMMAFIKDHVVGPPPEVDKKLVKRGIKRKLGPHVVSTIERRVSSLSAIHNRQGFPYIDNPCRQTRVREVLMRAKSASVRKGIKPKQKWAIDKALLDKMLATFSMREKDKRDRAILLFAFATGGRRRSEVAAARLDDLNTVRGGYLYYMPMSKTDQTGKGYMLPVRGKAAEALRAWIRVADIHDGYIFRAIRRGEITKDPIQAATVNAIVKQRVEMAGRNPDDYGAHSLRRGFLTECGRQGIPLRDSMQMSTHKDVRTAILYHEEGEIWRNPAARLI